MAYIREIERPLTPEEVAERHPPEAWRAMWDEALAKPIPPYDGTTALKAFLAERSRCD